MRETLAFPTVTTAQPDRVDRLWCEPNPDAPSPPRTTFWVLVLLAPLYLALAGFGLLMFKAWSGIFASMLLKGCIRTLAG